MKITFNRTYRSKGVRNPATKGKLRFSYTVSGTKAELASFKKAQGEFYVEDEKGAPIMNLLHDVGQSTGLIQTQDGRFIPDTSRLDRIKDLAEQHPFLAGELAKEMIKSLAIGASVSTAVVAEEPANLGK